MRWNLANFQNRFVARGSYAVLAATGDYASAVSRKQSSSAANTPEGSLSPVHHRASVHASTPIRPAAALCVSPRTERPCTDRSAMCPTKAADHTQNLMMAGMYDTPGFDRPFWQL
jgi:hypothetical protein